MKPLTRKCLCCSSQELYSRHRGRTRPRGPVLTTVFCPVCDTAAPGDETIDDLFDDLELT